MNPSHLDIRNRRISEAFSILKKEHPDRLQSRLKLSWSNWGFGREALADSACRLAGAGIRYIELHGNHYGADLGYRVDETRKIMGDYGITVAGICGMFSSDNDLSGVRPAVRQAALDYLRRELDFAAAIKAEYLLVVPGAVGRPQPADDNEFERSAATLRQAGDWFVAAGINGAIEPIRSAEVSFCHTVADAQAYIAAVKHCGIGYINGDVYHMQSEELHIGEAILAAGPQLVNLHLADSNRGALGTGSLDLDTIIRALYLIGFNQSGGYVTPEPLGPGGDPYPAMYGHPDSKALDRLVTQTANYFREREAAVLEESSTT